MVVKFADSDRQRESRKLQKMAQMNPMLGFNARMFNAAAVSNPYATQAAAAASMWGQYAAQAAAAQQPTSSSVASPYSSSLVCDAFKMREG